MGESSEWPATRRLLVVGDVHGDFELMVRLLRDLGRVIRPVVAHGGAPPPLHGYNYQNTEEHSCGHEWCGSDTFVVMCGDMLDRHRPGLSAVDSRGGTRGEIPQEEIRLLLFLEAVDQMARRDGGRIIRLFGNHEALNVAGAASHYSSPLAHSTKITVTGELARYLHSITPWGTAGAAAGRRRKPPSPGVYSRSRFFTPGSPGMNLLVAGGGPRAVARVGRWVFVHGGISDRLRDEFSSIDEVNARLLHALYHNRLKEHELWFGFSGSSESLTWNRKFGCTSVSMAEQYATSDKHRKLIKRRQFPFCGDLSSLLVRLEAATGTRDLNLVVAHCPQVEAIRMPPSGMRSGLVLVGDPNAQWNTSDEDQIHRMRGLKGMEVYRRGRWDHVDPDDSVDVNDRGTSFGINRACSARLWRVDVAMSRAFTSGNEETGPVRRARQPQLLEILDDGREVRVLRLNDPLPSDTPNDLYHVEVPGEENRYKSWTGREQKKASDLHDNIVVSANDFRELRMTLLFLAVVIAVALAISRHVSATPCKSPSDGISAFIEPVSRPLPEVTMMERRSVAEPRIYGKVF